MKLPNKDHIIAKLKELVPRKKTSKIAKTPTVRTQKQKVLIGIGAFLGVLVLIVGMFALVSFIHLQSIKAKTVVFRQDAQTALGALKSQNLPEGNQAIDQAQSTLADIQKTYNKLSFWKYSPLRVYYQDGQHALNAASAGLDSGKIFIQAVAPYADVIGFTGEGSFAGGTVEDRIAKIIETLELVSPKIDQVIEKLDYIDQEIHAIEPSRYPIEYQGRSVEELIKTAKESIAFVGTTVKQVRPILDELPSIAGVNEKKTYLVMFQNDAELRPTGGFLTAYAVMEVDNGKVRPIKSDDIYELDAKFSQRLQPPDIIKEHLLVYYWNLRDMNISPDFVESMDTFIPYYTQLPGEPEELDGVIAVDTQLLSSLIEVLGPVEVPGYGTFTSEIDPRCDCPQVIYALEDIATRPTPYHRSDRKAVLGPLMREILFKTYSSKERIPDLFQTAWKNMQEKHMLFYFFDDQTQKAVEELELAGRIIKVDTDYLHINDSNFGGAKSNMFVSQEVEQTIEVGPDQTTKTLVITYKNPRPGDNCNLEAGELCLNGILNNWMRIYVPSGAQIIDTVGFEEGTVKMSQDLDYDVIEGVFKLAPEAAAKLQVMYTIPYAPTDTYQLYIQKQPGTKLPEHTVVLDPYRESFQLNTDKELNFTITP